MKRSKHNLSHYRLLTGDMGELLPIGCVEVLPGDTVQHGVSMLVRASPLATPPMHPVIMRVHHWFCPIRILWSEFEDFITGGPDGLNASALPTTSVVSAEGSLADYLGVPVSGSAQTVNVLPFRAYQKIFNENYRDEDLVPLAPISMASGNDTTTLKTLQKVAWEKDRFTTARPWEQKGPSITMPIGTSAPVKTAASPLVSGTQNPMTLKRASGAALTANTAIGTGDGIVAAESGTATTGPYTGIYPDNLFADLASATGITVNELRESLALQRFAEARARYGSRFTEYLRFLGVRSSDARLQRPEYLGGGRQPLQFSEVLQTAQTAGSPDGVGQLFGHGIGAVRSNRYRRFIEEHGYIVSLAYVLPRTMYPQGLSRMWNRRVREDFWQKELEHIGQAPIQNKEVYHAHTSPDATFGFQDRYDDYRRLESSVHGEFRSVLNDWHFARIFSADPVLNASFVTADPAKRPFQAQSNDVLLMLAHHQLVARRILAKAGSSFIF